jgi:xanthine dehydrogenase YagS FAD-binding subunit
MQIFKFSRAANAAQAIQAAAVADTAQQGAQVRFIAGGTTLVDLMKLNVERPTTVIDINQLPFNSVKNLPDGRLKIGALVRNADLAHHPVIGKSYSVLSQALLSGASAQLRNMATTGGNLLQRTRCMYFRNDAMPCNKREPGTGCPAIGGANRTLAILGTSGSCIATNPSDMNVALTALEATIQIRGTRGEKEVSIGDFFLVPGNTPHRENILEPGDLITSITLPAPRRSCKQAYLKLRDRASYEFALASAAVLAEIRDGSFSFVRVALGGVGTKAWRSVEAEKALLGKPVEEKAFRRAADVALQDAHPQSENGFKVELAKRCITHALTLATRTV